MHQPSNIKYIGGNVPDEQGKGSFRKSCLLRAHGNGGVKTSLAGSTILSFSKRATAPAASACPYLSLQARDQSSSALTELQSGEAPADSQELIGLLENGAKSARMPLHSAN